MNAILFWYELTEVFILMDILSILFSSILSFSFNENHVSYKKRNVKGVHMHFSFIHLILLVHRNIFSISIHLMLFKIQENIGNNTWVG